jgi:hypothetical protein
MLHGIAIALHVVVAVLAVGLVGAVPLTARWARQSPDPIAGSGGILAALLRAIQLGLLLMLVTGVALDWSVAGGFHRMGWFKASMVVLVLIGVCLGRARAALRGNALRRVEQWGWAMCASVAAITVLMQMKP